MSPRDPFRLPARLLVLAAVALAALPALPARVAVGDAFPALNDSALSLEGRLPPLAGQVTLVDFWASWCEPCQASFPVYARLHADYGARGLAIAGVSVDKQRAAYDAFLKRLQPPFVTVRDVRHRLASTVEVPAMPTCFLIGRDGRVRFVGVGFHGAATTAELQRAVEAALAEK
ncbi:TlpA family protein disulfide reductase [Oleiharenicola sp. Vm1]|uniref:TlpA family protein disulfide reductase n=1 Tax=Oleiharenicola sp. Vm1 TaxID=3398393 RepID=UPI0039F62165